MPHGSTASKPRLLNRIPGFARRTMMFRGDDTFVAADLILSTRKRWRTRPESRDPGWQTARAGLFVVALRLTL